MRETELKIASTPITPFFHFDFKSGMIEFRGRSLPSSPQKFYYPILEEIDTAFKKGVNKLTANFALEYFNTSSSKCLFNILKKLASYQQDGENVVINWFYEACDDDMKETGQDYEKILGVSFNHIQVN